MPELIERVAAKVLEVAEPSVPALARGADCLPGKWAYTDDVEAVWKAVLAQARREVLDAR